MILNCHVIPKRVTTITHLHWVQVQHIVGIDCLPRGNKAIVNNQFQNNVFLCLRLMNNMYRYYVVSFELSLRLDDFSLTNGSEFTGLLYSFTSRCRSSSSALNWHKLIDSAVHLPAPLSKSSYSELDKGRASCTWLAEELYPWLSLFHLSKLTVPQERLIPSTICQHRPMIILNRPLGARCTTPSRS